MQVQIERLLHQKFNAMDGVKNLIFYLFAKEKGYNIRYIKNWCIEKSHFRMFLI